MFNFRFRLKGGENYMPTCGKCGNHSFKIQSNEPAGSQFVVYFVQCSSCGTPIGVLEYSNTGALIEKLERKINSLNSDVEQIGYQLTNIQDELRRK